MGNFQPQILSCQQICSCPQIFFQKYKHTEYKIFFQKYKIGGWKSPILWEFGAKLEILNTDNLLCQNFAAVCLSLKIATFCLRVY